MHTQNRCSRKGKSRPIIVKFVKYEDRRRVFTNIKRLKGKNMSITKKFTKIRRSAYLFAGFFTKQSKSVSYFVFLISILLLIKLILIKI